LQTAPPKRIILFAIRPQVGQADTNLGGGHVEEECLWQDAYARAQQHLTEIEKQMGAMAVNLSPVVNLAWQLACVDASAARFWFIEPEHFAAAIAKLEQRRTGDAAEITCALVVEPPDPVRRYRDLDGGRGRSSRWCGCIAVAVRRNDVGLVLSI
jgi:hypothetical protein